MMIVWLAAMAQEAVPVDHGAFEVIHARDTGEVLFVQGSVEYSDAGRTAVPAEPSQPLDAGDTLKTLASSRAGVGWNRPRHGTVLHLRDRTLLLIESAAASQDLSGRFPAEGRPAASRPVATGSPRGEAAPTTSSVLLLKSGSLYVSHRGPAPPPWIRTRQADIVPKGTEYAVTVNPDLDQTELLVLEGGAEISNDTETRLLSPLSLAVATPGRPIEVRSVLQATNIVQWWTFHPGILDVDELDSRTSRDGPMQASLRAYRAGDLREAFRLHPAQDPSWLPQTESARTYWAAVLLGAGEVARAQLELARLGADLPLANALRTLTWAVSHPELRSAQPAPQTEPELRTASEWLALSYELQAAQRLGDALRSARRAVERSARFGFGWVRVAELELSHGRVTPAREALQIALELSPRNAQAHALQGFLEASQNRLKPALSAFDEAIRLDPQMGNGWLGRGLTRIRRGELEAGRRDLRTAALVEPHRSLVRSYAGKAFGDAGWMQAARDELALAGMLDAKDPTPWLYQALLDQQDNRINEGIQNLEISVALNDNRRVYRSAFLLDEDRAVRSVNLANLYRDAGLTDLSVREATRAVNADYANAAAHQFLADSYSALRDPRQVNLRYEAPWFSEFLVANLLAPVGAGTLSQTISQQEYSKLLQRDGFGVASETTWTSNGDWMESGAQVGQFGNFEYALDSFYRSEVGQRSNNDLEQLTVSLKAKTQFQPADTLFLQSLFYDQQAGDVAQYYEQDTPDSAQAYSPAKPNPLLRSTERQEPIVLAGWHHEWKPGVHSLLLVSPWRASASVDNPLNLPWVGVREEDGSITRVTDGVEPAALEYATRFTGWSAELQQLWQAHSHSVVGGLRFQSGQFDTQAAMDVRAFHNAPPDQPYVQDFGAVPSMRRMSVYAYDQWQVLPWVLVTAGLTYDRLEAPVNFTLPPLTGAEDTLDQTSPKVGLTLAPWKGGTLRAAYTRALGGVSFDQSYRLEPVQVAGFTQIHRGLMPESLVGLVAGQDLEHCGVALEQQFRTRTYLAVAAHQTTSAASRGVGAFIFDSPTVTYAPATLEESLRFQERVLDATANQLLSKHFALGLHYRLSEAELDGVLADVNDSLVHQRSVLHQLAFSTRFNHPCGFFARWDSVWSHQSNAADASSFDGDDFWQHNLWAGWRFWQRRAEIAVGVLNLGDQGYHLYPLSYYPETYRERTLGVSARFSL